MRLGQLARKISIRQAEIVQFLASHNIQIEDGSNTRVENDHVTLVVKHYAPSLLITEPVAESVQETYPQANIENTVAEEDQPETVDADDNTNTRESNEAEEVSSIEIPEVIKAPKVELPGLKVIGKIELPEPKKKEAEAAEPESSEATIEEVIAQPKVRGPEKKFIKPNRGTRMEQPKPRKNPIALQREREAMEAEQKRKEHLEKERQKRAAYYHKRVKPATPTKAIKLVKEEVEEMSLPAREMPTSVWGKFMRWLRRS
ncbi:MAG: hypothetical protein JNM57_13115 [Cyclobacteriaceae bacterium]|nr:hypothetical protein [Cyclobacteriaceae bacterium]